MKRLGLFAGVIATLLLSGCAETRPEASTKIGYVEKLDNQAIIAGSHRIEIVKAVSWATHASCSVLDFVTHVTSLDSEIHDVINIRAEEGRSSSMMGGTSEVSCKYWGLAIRYVPVVDSVQPASAPETSVAPAASMPPMMPIVQVAPANCEAPVAPAVPVQNTTVPSESKVSAEIPAPVSTNIVPIPEPMPKESADSSKSKVVTPSVNSKK